MTGVLADCLALVQVALQDGLDEFQSYSRTLSVLEFTQKLANACQGRAFGGPRKKGSVVIVATNQLQGLFHQGIHDIRVVNDAFLGSILVVYAQEFVARIVR